MDGAAGVILPRHDAKISRLCAEGHPVARPIGALTSKAVTSCYQAFEVVNVRRLLLIPRHLVVTAVGVQPGDGERVLAAVVVKEHWANLRLTRCWGCCRREQC